MMPCLADPDFQASMEKMKAAITRSAEKLSEILKDLVRTNKDFFQRLKKIFPGLEHPSINYSPPVETRARRDWSRPVDYHPPHQARPCPRWFRRARCNL